MKSYNKNSIILTSIIMIFLLFASCSSLKYKVKRNNKFTGKFIRKIYDENKNVFFIQPYYANISFVWTHKKDSVIVYEIIDGKYIKKTNYNNASKQQIVIPSNEEEYYSDFYKKGCFVLDGNFVGFILLTNENKRIENVFTLDIGCFKKTEYDSKFLNFIQKEIIEYNIWTFD